MIELKKENYDLVAALFKETLHNKPLVFSVIERNYPGRIFADNNYNPAIALVSFDDYMFLTGDDDRYDILNNSLLDFIFSEIVSKTDLEYFEFYTYSNVWYKKAEELFKEKIIDKRIRKTFKFNIASYRDLGNWENRIPINFIMKKIDSYFVERYNIDKNFWNPALKRFGYCLCHGDEIISQCVSVFVGGGMAEIGIDTNELYRNRGFATLTASAFIDFCLSENITPNWTCWEIREASIALAHKLGFTDLTDTPVLILKYDKG